MVDSHEDDDSRVHDEKSILVFAKGDWRMTLSV